MKLTILALLSTLTCACASAPARAPVAINGADYQPPVQTELVWNQKVVADQQQSEADKTAREEETYRNSVSKIEEQLGTERLNLQACWSVYGEQSKECWSLLRKSCEVDTILDSRSGYHAKEYCSKSFLDYHNPILRH